MNVQNRLAATALMSVVLASQGAFAQGFGISPRGTGTGQDTTAPGSKGDQQRKARAAHGRSGASRDASRMKGHHGGAPADPSASGAASSSKMSQ